MENVDMNVFLLTEASALVAQYNTRCFNRCLVEPPSVKLVTTPGCIYVLQDKESADEERNLESLKPAVGQGYPELGV